MFKFDIQGWGLAFTEKVGITRILISLLFCLSCLYQHSWGWSLSTLLHYNALAQKIHSTLWAANICWAMSSTSAQWLLLTPYYLKKLSGHLPGYLEYHSFDFQISPCRLRGWWLVPAWLVPSLWFNRFQATIVSPERVLSNAIPLRAMTKAQQHEILNSCSFTWIGILQSRCIFVKTS